MPLGQLYAWAVKAVPKTGNYANEAYLRLWLGCARHQWCFTSSCGHVPFAVPGDRHTGVPGLVVAP